MTGTKGLVGKELFYLKEAVKFRITKGVSITNIMQAVTWSCNLRCKYCSIWKRYADNPGKRRDELATQEFEMIAADPILKLREIDFFGGEPFLRKDLEEITEIFCTHNSIRDITIPTNGTLTKRVARYIDTVRSFYSGNLYIGVSIDGTQATHDRLRGVKGTFRRARRTFDMLVERSDVRTGVMAFINKENWDLVEDMNREFGDRFFFYFSTDNKALGQAESSLAPGEEKYAKDYFRRMMEARLFLIN